MPYQKSWIPVMGNKEIDSDEESNGDDEPELERNSMALVDEELPDEMDEFGYSGLDQVKEDDKEWEDSHLGQDALNAEDGCYGIRAPTRHTLHSPFPRWRTIFLH